MLTEALRTGSGGGERPDCLEWPSCHVASAFHQGGVMRSNQKFLSILAACATAVATIAMGGPVSASTLSSEGPDSTLVMEVPMTYVGFDDDVARQNGYEVRTGSDGREYAVRAGAPAGAPAVAADLPPITNSEVRGAWSRTASQLANPVGGDCGTSFVLTNDTVRGRYKIDTGWSVRITAVTHSWSVLVTGPAGKDTTHRWGGVLLGRQVWTGTTVGAVNVTGTYRARASGSATDVFGRTCTSANPVDTDVIYG